MLQAPFL
nr:translational initiation factor 1 [Cryptocoryne elliptica]UHY39552.1 translational initiation factor 1 [Cryptocoryne elliptica]